MFKLGLQHNLTTARSTVIVINDKETGKMAKSQVLGQFVGEVLLF